MTLYGCNDVDSGILKHIGKIKSLQALSLHATSVTDEDLSLLRELPDLQGLMLAFTEITRQSGPHLEQLKNLRRLQVGAPQMGDGILGHVAKLSQLEHLAVGALVTDEGLPLLAGLKELKVLVLNYTPVTEAGVLAMPQWPKLQELWLIGLPLTSPPTALPNCMTPCQIAASNGTAA